MNNIHILLNDLSKLNSEVSHSVERQQERETSLLLV